MFKIKRVPAVIVIPFVVLFIMVGIVFISMSILKGLDNLECPTFVYEKLMNSVEEVNDESVDELVRYHLVDGKLTIGEVDIISSQIYNVRKIRAMNKLMER